MRSQLTITDLTRMQGTKICVAGYLPTGECIRPVLPKTYLTESWLFRNRPRILKPFAVIELELSRPAADRVPPHTEDWEIEPGYDYRADLSPRDRFELLYTTASSHVGSLFGSALSGREAGHGLWIQHGTGLRSLGTIHIRQITEVIFQIRPDGKGAYRLQFEDEAGADFRLPVTDLAFRMYLDSLLGRQEMTPGEAARFVQQSLQDAPDVFLRLGLARYWDQHPDRCYLQVNGVYSFPDYLDGRCFADFIETPRVEVPF
ncbi:MAG: hypothetical protein M3464_00500 [Chloroflexota bacterium]|nr:hypothetical protein [Chloroflexota bacterium]